MVAVARAVALEGSRLPLGLLLTRGYSQKLVRLVAGCWEADPLRRPAASEAHKQLLLAVQEAELGLGAVRGQGQEAVLEGSVGALDAKRPQEAAGRG